MEEEYKLRLEALMLKVCHLTNEMEILKIEKEFLLNEVKNSQLKLHLNISPQQSHFPLDI